MTRASEPEYLLGENVCTVRSSRAGDGLRHLTHASLHITPCAFLLLQLAHHMVQQHIPSTQDNVCVCVVHLLAHSEIVALGVTEM